jgi:hypothetical protein
MRKRAINYIVWAILVAVILAAIVSTWEVREGRDSAGQWVVLSRRVVLPWQEKQQAVASAQEAEAYTDIRIRWWTLGGMQAESRPIKQGEVTR